MFILKSRSPRRIEILKNLGIQFDIDPSDVNESQLKDEKPLDYLHRIVNDKLGQKTSRKDENLYLTCDTIVVQKEEILHKPADPKEAFAILSRLNGQSHTVYSGCMISFRGELDFFFEETKIQFKLWDEAQVRDYINRCKPWDKAGSYGIQDENNPVLKWNGSYQNVMGFPIRSFFMRWEKWTPFWSQPG